MDPGSLLLFGNQPLELEERAQALIKEALKTKEEKEALFIFDCRDFLKTDQQGFQVALQDLRNAAEMVSFFSENKVLWIRHLETLPKKKSPIEKINKELNEIHLFKLPVIGGEGWFDADSLSSRPHGHNHITAKQLVLEILPLEQGGFYFELALPWVGGWIHRQHGQEAEAVGVQLFLEQKLKSKITFDRPSLEEINEDPGSSGLVKTLTEYVLDPPDGLRLILTADIKKETELPKDLVAALQKNGKIQKLTVAYDDFSPVTWVQSRAREKRLSFSKEAAMQLIEIAGSDFTTLDHELEKLVVLLGPGAQPSPLEVAEKTGHSKKYSVFLVAEFLSKRELNHALEAIEQLLGDKKTEAPQLLGLIAFGFRKLIKVKWLLEEGLSAKQIGERLKMPEWQLRPLISQAENFGRSELENILIELSEQDLATKYAGKEAGTILENLAFSICRGLFAGSRPINAHWVP